MGFILLWLSTLSCTRYIFVSLGPELVNKILVFLWGQLGFIFLWDILGFILLWGTFWGLSSCGGHIGIHLLGVYPHVRDLLGFILLSGTYWGLSSCGGPIGVHPHVGDILGLILLWGKC